MSEPVPAAAENAWRQLQDHWDDEQAHRRFVALCQAVGALSYAGGQYRQVSDQRDAREAMARRQIDAVVASAAAELFAQRQPAPQRRAPVFTIVTVIVSGSAILYTLKLILSTM